MVNALWTHNRMMSAAKNMDLRPYLILTGSNPVLTTSK